MDFPLDFLYLSKYICITINERNEVKKKKERKKKMKNLNGMKKVARNVELHLTANDNSNRFGHRVIPNKKKKVRKFDYRKDAE
jgi:hypothetical protein